MPTVLARNWWTLVLRGVAAILFGVVAFLAPGISLAALILLFAVYAVADGVFNIVGAVKGAKRHEERWGLNLFAGIVSIAAGVLAVIWPGVTALALVFWIAAWAIITGTLEIAAAVRLRRTIKGEWLMVLSGVLSIAFGVLLMLAPGPGALALVLWIGAWAVVFGGVLIALGVRLYRWSRKEEGPPVQQVPVPA